MRASSLERSRTRHHAARTTKFHLVGDEMKLLFIGPPGAGKGTQAALVAERMGIPHISTGEMFRSHVAMDTDLGREVQRIMESGAYVPDEITVEMLRQRMAEPDAAAGFILDGFPRTAPQVAALDKLIGTDGLDKVVLFDVDEDVLAERMLSRGRSDDTEETIRNRFKVYHEQTAPLIDLYQGRGLVVRVDGLGDIDDVTSRVLDAVAMPPTTRSTHHNGSEARP